MAPVNKKYVFNVELNDFKDAPAFKIENDIEELKKTIEESEKMGEKFEPFAHTSLILSPFIALEFVSSEYYSMADFTKHLKEYVLEQELNSSNKET